ncbi:MAG: MlaD family protein [Terracidiphilus sp.]|jgi:phospholipid/cholesterol/gamma-HCH transport system substrate-binding protein
MSRVARLGVFIVGALVVLATGVFIIGSKEYLFRSTYQLKAQFDDVAGLSEGADVQVGGVHSGTVHSILLPHKPSEKVTVIMDMDRSTREIIKQDSVASIETEGLLGNQFVAISFGSEGQADVKNGDTIQGMQPLLMTDLLKKANGLLDNSQQAMLSAAAATAHLNSISAKIDSGEGTVGALVNDKQLYANLEQTTGSLHETMQQAEAGVTDFQENMEALKHNFLLKGYFKKRGYEDSNDLTANQISAVPQDTPVKTFSYSARQLFDARDSTKLKNQKSLNPSGEYLADNEFGYAIVVVSAGPEGDTKKDLLLTQARAMMVREYLVENFGFDDSQLKTVAMGKQVGSGKDSGWGEIQILVFPKGAVMPTEKQPAVGNSSTADGSQSGQEAAATAQKSR